MRIMLWLSLVVVLGVLPADAKRLAELHAKYPSKIESISDTGSSIIIEYKEGVTQPERDAIEADKAVFDFNDAPKPNFKQFLLDCFADGSIPATTRRDVSQIGLWVKAGEKDLAVALWDQIKGALSAPVKSAIQQHALNNNITLN